MAVRSSGQICSGADALLAMLAYAGTTTVGVEAMSTWLGFP